MILDYLRSKKIGIDPNALAFATKAAEVLKAISLPGTPMPYLPVSSWPAVMVILMIFHGITLFTAATTRAKGRCDSLKVEPRYKPKIYG